MFAIAQSVGESSMPEDIELMDLVQRLKHSVPDDRCDTDEYPGCGGPLYRWMLRTTLDYWPVIRCENHLKLQDLWQQYQANEWAKIADGPWYDEKLRPRSFWEWLAEHWNDDTSEADIGPYWKLILAENGDFD